MPTSTDRHRRIPECARELMDALHCSFMKHQDMRRAKSKRALRITHVLSDELNSLVELSNAIFNFAPSLFGRIGNKFERSTDALTIIFHRQSWSQ